jgi:hypothetical protein
MATPVVCASVALARRVPVSAFAGLAVVLAAACASRGDPFPAASATVLHEIPVSRVREIRRVRGVDPPLVYGRPRRPGVVLDVILTR